MTKDYSKGLIILASGGTGGHVFTATATAEELEKRGFSTLHLTDKRGLKYIKTSNYKIIASASPSSPVAMLKLGIGVLQSFFLLLFKQPRAVIGFGGYPSFPPLVAAKLLGIKTILHEQNSVLGKVNRYLAKSATAVAVAFPDTKFANNARYIGQPVRKGISESAYPALNGKLNILITGGSQGAKLFAEVLPGALCKFADKISVVHQVPDNKVADVKEKYTACKVEAEIKSFFDDMPERLTKAHLVIARAGSGTVFELATVGRPAIFIPLKIAADNHQFHNTESLCNARASWMLEEKDFNENEVSAILEMILAAPQLLSEAAEKIKKFARPNAAAALADLAEEISK